MKTNKPVRETRHSSLAVNLLCTVLLFVGFLCIFSALWYIREIGRAHV